MSLTLMYMVIGAYSTCLHTEVPCYDMQACPPEDDFGRRAWRSAQASRGKAVAIFLRFLLPLKRDRNDTW